MARSRTSAWQQGFDAFIDGTPVDENPFRRARSGFMSVNRQHWYDGWYDARFAQKYGNEYLCINRKRQDHHDPA